jgi:glycosyltransferase involved in cell wall biosynthesis
MHADAIVADQPKTVPSTMSTGLPPASPGYLVMQAARELVAVVVIGRNEGERLRRCLTSVVGPGQAHVVVYVDSGSTDGSVAMAQSMGVMTVPLDMSLPFTAARARNVGFAAATKLAPDVEHVQFIDGDTEMSPEWLNKAKQFMRENLRAAAVFGRRRERHPEASVYNELCDLEWAVAPGTSRYCGGDVMIRRSAFDDVRGYSDELIAGEEPDLCVRLRHQQWSIHCIDAEMTQHDAAILHFHQWWRRTTRSGYAFAQGAYRFGAAPDFHWVRESTRTLVWGLLLPTMAVVLALTADVEWLWLLLIYPLQVLRVYARTEGSNHSRWVRASFYTLARFPELMGLLKFHYTRLLRRTPTIIEYK